MNYLEGLYNEYPWIKDNMKTHNFKKNDYNYNDLEDDLARYTCIKCNYLAVDIFWSGNKNYCIDVTKAKPITCNEAIIKNIIE